jgi:regulator of protease activity HflC (stomatin/prohibitin superfamily)
VATEAEAARNQRLAEAQAEGIRVVGEAEGSAETARLAAYRDLQEGVLLGIALRELAGNLPKISNLILTPDLIAPVLARLAAPAVRKGTSREP